MLAAGDPARLVGAVFTSTVTPPPLQGMGRMRNSTAQRWSDAGAVKRNVLVGENPTNAMMMMAVTRRRRSGSVKGPGRRTTKKPKK